MDGYLNWKNDTEEEQKCKHLIGRLQAARNKLTPIIDDIIVSAVDSIQRGDNKFLSECTLTVDQYQDVIWASQILREIEYQCRTDDEKYKLPNSTVIVNNVSVDHKSRMMSVRDKSIVIDEAIVVELLELYEQMGVVIQRMVAERTHASDQPPMPTSAKRITSESSTSERTLRSRSSSRKYVTTTDTSLSDVNEKHEDKESTPPHIKSTFDISDAEDDNKNYKDTPISCAKNCPSHYHVRLDGKPVTLKMNQVKNNAEEGAVYCINTGSDDNDNDIRIVIKQCPECRSTVIASSSRIQGFGGESHESITLHGKGGDETDMTYSSDGSNNMCTCHDKGVIYINISRVRCDDRYTPPCSCSESEGHRSQRKLDVVIDTDNVDQSTVKVRSESSIASIHDSDSKPTSFTRAKSSVDHIHGKNVAIKPEPGIPLTRRRICSSMEFDVSTVHSRLRDREIEHGNAHIVVELKKLGVDKILRACRPAKCCRQAILDEKQRTALPYCVSLKSLPLMGNDAEVIKQSIDMSVKKIKNSLDLTQAYKDKLAFYVSLGKDDFKPNVNFPWQISHDSKLEEKSCKHFSSRCLPKCEEKKSKKSVKKKMEYYVSLINGDLVWGEALPLLPQNYDTYYNYSNHNDKEPTPPSTPVEDPMVATRVTNDTSHRAYSRAATPSENEYQNQSDSPDDRSIISELITDPDNMPLESQEKNNDSPKSKFPPFSMGPESLYAPWSPFLVSEHSLPRIREEVIEKEEAPPVEAEPVPAKEETKPKSKCSSKSVCVRNSCVKCKSKECQGKPSTSKKGHPRDAIRIAIKKTKDNGICVEGKAPKACNKEICEIYKNKSMMPDKSAKHRDRDQTFKISGKDNIEIYINNQKICVANNKNKKSTKSNNSKYEDSQRYEKNERMEKNEKTGNNEKMEKNEKTGKNEKMDK
ncbi:hypothetical protein GEV33_007902 [Tenebrio molitor]|uniref:Uncharacterized protein n=1 Tax=Tenebrio molitor TaxID=7067 RepID=A0A8J6HHS2_TENMO|nr:hypothetical protein GEV33_007902 [Tenebrio molitor]